MDNPRIAAAILAGGRAERLGGVNKALLEIGGLRMIDRIVRALAVADPILLCAGPNVFPDDIGLPAISDLPADYAGPLAGVAAAVAALSARPPEMLLTVAVDTPFFPHDFAARAMPLLAGGSEVAVAAFAGQDYPTNALWRFEALKSLPAAVAAGSAPHSLKRLIDAHRSRLLDYAEVGAANPFANANSPDELQALRDSAGARNPG
jgi:molybdopterin-guanine dinucleotide biosynthesis protein A